MALSIERRPHLDTVVVDSDALVLELVWRALFRCPPKMRAASPPFGVTARSSYELNAAHASTAAALVAWDAVSSLGESAAETALLLRAGLNNVARPVHRREGTARDGVQLRRRFRRSSVASSERRPWLSWR